MNFLKICFKNPKTIQKKAEHTRNKQNGSIQKQLKIPFGNQRGREMAPVNNSRCPCSLD